MQLGSKKPVQYVTLNYQALFRQTKSLKTNLNMNNIYHVVHRLRNFVKFIP